MMTIIEILIPEIITKTFFVGACRGRAAAGAGETGVATGNGVGSSQSSGREAKSDSNSFPPLVEN
jgi:hypothetical protein